MKARELMALAPLGAKVAYSDGTPEPPARHKKKLQAWKGSNGSGYFTKLNPGSERAYDRPHFTLMQPGRVLTVMRIFGEDSASEFEVTPPAPGTILAYSEFEGKTEVRHVWPTLTEAQAWAVGYGRGPSGKDYEFSKCGYRFWLIGENGERVDYMPPDPTV